MSKKIRDRVLGEMIGIAEVERLTGISRSTMRNWRKAEHAHLAKFVGYQIVGTRDVMYRLDDVKLWLEQNGKDLRTAFEPIPAPNALSAPMISPEIGESKQEALDAIAQITSETAYEPWFTRFNQMNGELSMGEVRKQVEWWGKATGNPTAGVERVPPMMAWDNPTNSEVFFIGFTLAMRSVLNQLQGLGLSDAELMSVPIGPVPPMRK